MTGSRAWIACNTGAVAAVLLGITGCVVGSWLDGAAMFSRAWLCAYLVWLGVPLGGVTLVLVHDLTGGRWMASARPVLNAAIAAMPLATLAAIPAFAGLHALYSWTHPAASLTNTWYLNATDFYVRWGIYVALWNLIALYALWGPRGLATPIAPPLSWLSGVALMLLAVSASFAAIDWIMSLVPSFWSSIFPYGQCASWFNTGLALVLLGIALVGQPTDARRGHVSDLAQILLATTIFWAYTEFMQFLIIWEENLKFEIVWYLTRVTPAWKPALYIAAGGGFFVPFFVLLWAPSKHNRGVVAIVCVVILLSRIADKWWLVLPEYRSTGPLWLDAAAVLALGGAIALLFAWALRRSAWLWSFRLKERGAQHG